MHSQYYINYICQRVNVFYKDLKYNVDWILDIAIFKIGLYLHHKKTFTVKVTFSNHILRVDLPQL